MNMPTETDTFLDAERAIAELLNNLESLKAEIEGYAEANTALEEARNGLAHCAAQLTRLSQSAEPILKALGAIGTPEILKRIEDMRATNQELLAQHERSTASIRESLRAIDAKTTETANDLKTSVARATGSIEHVAQSIESIVAAIPKRTSEAINPEMKSALNAARDALDRKITRLTVINFVFLALATVAVVVALRR